MELIPKPACGITMRSRCWNTSGELAVAVAGELAAEISRSAPSPHAVMLAGGTTPLEAYRLLAERPPAVDGQCHLLFSDDRHVPPDSPQSNFGQAQPLLQGLALPAARVLRVQGERPLSEATEHYEAALDSYLSGGGSISLGLLGLGADGHTASLFNAEHVREGARRWAIPVARPDGLQGVSVTRRLLMQVQRILFVVSGSSKQAMARALVAQPRSIAAGLAVAGHARVELWTDRAAWPF